MRKRPKMTTIRHMTVTQENVRVLRQKPQPKSDPRKDLIKRVLAEIREDAQENPSAYLRDTVVPEGGE